MGIFKTASLDPSTYRRDIPEPETGKVQIVQEDFGMQVRGIGEMHVPCKCGRPLVGIEHEWIHDPKGSALFVRGICLSHGLQTTIYLSDPTPQTEQAYEAKLLEDVRRMVFDVMQARAIAQTDGIEAALDFTDGLQETA